MPAAATNKQTAASTRCRPPVQLPAVSDHGDRLEEVAAGAMQRHGAGLHPEQVVYHGRRRGARHDGRISLSLPLLAPRPLCASCRPSTHAPTPPHPTPRTSLSPRPQSGCRTWSPPSPPRSLLSPTYFPGSPSNPPSSTLSPRRCCVSGWGPAGRLNRVLEAVIRLWECLCSGNQ